MGKRIFLVRPTVHLVKDEAGNTIRSDYSYAPCPSSKVQCLAWNRDQNPPNGDFLQEQMWVVEGPEESLDLFASDPGVEEISEADCCSLAPLWDGPKEIDERLTPGARVVCPDCGKELACPDCGPMNGKTPTAKRSRKGWDLEDHKHHLVGLDAPKLKKNP